jgi:hypothetical protein
MKSFKLRTITKLSLVLLVAIGFSACKSMNSGAKSSSSKHPETKLGWKLGSQAYTFNRFTFFDAIRKIC